jgi:RNA polymerase sigma-70 factor (ECF subfamily)
MDVSRSAITVTELVEGHYQWLYRFAVRLCGHPTDAEDLTQQTFLAAHAKIEQLREPEHARAWLCAILRNVYLKRLRKPGAGPVVSLADLPEPAGELPANVDVDSEEMQAALLELAEEFRTPLLLFYFDECSYKEIAARLDLPIGTVMSRLARAKAHLRERLSVRNRVGSVPEGERG